MFCYSRGWKAGRQGEDGVVKLWMGDQEQVGEIWKWRMGKEWEMRDVKIGRNKMDLRENEVESKIKWYFEVRINKIKLEKEKKRFENGKEGNGFKREKMSLEVQGGI